MNPEPGHTGKRKEPDEDHVILSSSKRLRQDIEFPIIYEDLPYPDSCAMEMESLDTVLADLDSSPPSRPEVPPLTPTDEKAMVLYKSVKPPLFPGGPIDLPIRIHIPGYNGFLNLLNCTSSKEHALIMSVPEASQADKAKSSVSDSVKQLGLIPWVPIHSPYEVVSGQAEINEVPVDGSGSLECMEEEEKLNGCNGAEMSNPHFGLSSESCRHYGGMMDDFTNAPLNFMADNKMEVIESYLNRRQNSIGQSILTMDF